MGFNFTTSGAIIAKAGLNANSTATLSGVMLSKWNDQAEAVINTTTRKDWTTNYSSIKTNFKGILDDIASDMVAMRIINYDMSVFTSRTEAQTMLDVLRDNISRNLEVLKDQKVQEVM